MNKWRQKRRSKRYCHHEVPCYCGKPSDPKLKNEIDPWVFVKPSDLTRTDREQVMAAL